MSMASVSRARLLSAASHLDDLAHAAGVRVVVLEADMAGGVPCFVLNADTHDRTVFEFCLGLGMHGYRLAIENDGKNYVYRITGETP